MSIEGESTYQNKVIFFIINNKRILESLLIKLKF